jgi:hypothetical protein
MSDIERFRREQRAAMREFLVDVKKYVDHTIEMIDTADIHVRAFDGEILRSTASEMESWQISFDVLTRKQQSLEQKIKKING